MCEWNGVIVVEAVPSSSVMFMKCVDCCDLISHFITVLPAYQLS